MRDISSKIKTLRTAVAIASLKLRPETVRLLRDNKIPKGDPLPVAKIAAIQAVKNTHQIIPYCHPVPVDHVDVEFMIGDNTIDVQVTVKAIYKTGVEMEALTGASTAVLTLYDMMKMLDDTMEVAGVKLLEKRGGSTEFGEVFTKPLRAAVLVMSDSIAAGEKSDRSGQAIKKRLEESKIEVREYKIIPDEPEEIKKLILKYTDEMKLDLILTTGGTGMSPRDFTPETMKDIFERDIPGIPEALRAYGQERTPYSMLSRGKAGIRGKSIVINLPGSTRGVNESLDALFPYVLHAFKMLWGGGHGEQSKEIRGQKPDGSGTKK